MPRGPKGEKRPADVISAAIMIGKIAIGQIKDAIPTARTQPLSRWGAWAGRCGRQGVSQEAERDR